MTFFLLKLIPFLLSLATITNADDCKLCKLGVSTGHTLAKHNLTYKWIEVFLIKKICMSE